MAREGRQLRKIDSGVGTKTFTQYQEDMDAELLPDTETFQLTKFGNHFSNEIFDFDKKMTKAQLRRLNFQKATTKEYGPSVMKNLKGNKKNKVTTQSFLQISEDGSEAGT